MYVCVREWIFKKREVICTGQASRDAYQFLWSTPPPQLVELQPAVLRHVAWSITCCALPQLVWHGHVSQRALCQFLSNSKTETETKTQKQNKSQSAFVLFLSPTPPITLSPSLYAALLSSSVLELCLFMRTFRILL